MCWGLHDMQWKWCNKAKQQHDNNADMSLKSLHDNPSLLSAHVSCLKVDRTRGNSPQLASTPLSPLLLFALNELTMHPPWLLLKTMCRCLYLVNFLRDIVTTTSNILFGLTLSENNNVAIGKPDGWIPPPAVLDIPHSSRNLSQRHMSLATSPSIHHLGPPPVPETFNSGWPNLDKETLWILLPSKNYYGSVVGKCFYNPAGCMVSDPH